METTESNSEEENSELGLTLAFPQQKDCGVCAMLLDRRQAGTLKHAVPTHSSSLSSLG